MSKQFHEIESESPDAPIESAPQAQKFTAVDISPETSAPPDLGEQLLAEVDAIVIPDDSVDTYPELWGKLEEYLGHADAVDGLAAWNQGEMLNRIKPLPELEAQGWVKIAPHGEWESKFLVERDVPKSTAYLLRRYRSDFTREQAKNLGRSGMRKRILGRDARELEEPDILIAATACGHRAEVDSPLQQAVDSAGGNDDPPVKVEKPFDICNVPPQIARMNEALKALYQEMLAYEVGDSKEDRAVARQAIRKIRSALSGAKGMTSQIKSIKVALSTLCDSLKVTV